mmetsp:Transcript_32580/g.45202  ORF Transcript_32580/g.45202 Transcript_32580/m.45202 type:complete len:260 (-) Transcript_32580:250-1029(-)
MKILQVVALVICLVLFVSIGRAEYSTKWVMHAADKNTVQDHWLVSNIQFFDDVECKNDITIHDNIKSTIYDCCRNCEVEFGYNKGDGVKVVDVLLNKQCNSSYCQADPASNFAACETSDNRRHYVGFEFKQSVEVKCVRSCQATCHQDSVVNVAIVFWKENEITQGYGAWRQAASITLVNNESAVLDFDQKNYFDKHTDLQDVFPPPPPTPTGGGDDGLSTTEIVIIVAVTVFAGSVIMFLFVWYWKKKEHAVSKSPPV